MFVCPLCVCLFGINSINPAIVDYRIWSFEPGWVEMSEQESLTRKRKICGGHRASCTRVVRDIRALLTSTDQNGAKMKQQKRFLEEKLTLLRGLDGEILRTE